MGCQVGWTGHAQWVVYLVHPYLFILEASTPKPNLDRAELQDIRELKRDKSSIILTACKGVTMVVMDRQEYINKANNLQAQPPTDLSPRTLPTK